MARFTYQATGVALIELILLFGIAGILAIVAMPRMRVNTLTLSAQVNLLASDLRYTQHLAMTKGQRYDLYEVSTTSYQIRNASGVVVPFASGGNIRTLNSNILLTNSQGVLVAFNGRGVPCTTVAGSMLTTTTIITLSASGATSTVSIWPKSGIITIP